MLILYTDASFDYKHADETLEDFVRGKICVSDGNGYERIEKVVVGKVGALRQYINILELTAVARAVELASELKAADTSLDSLAIYTDSKIAMSWAINGKMKDKVRTVAHDNVLAYLRRGRLQFGGVITFNWVSRNDNPAGFALARELKREPPHTP